MSPDGGEQPGHHNTETVSASLPLGVEGGAAPLLLTLAWEYNSVTGSTLQMK